MYEWYGDAETRLRRPEVSSLSLCLCCQIIREKALVTLMINPRYLTVELKISWKKKWRTSRAGIRSHSASFESSASTYSVRRKFQT